jgi:hypothetical protein
MGQATMVPSPRRMPHLGTVAPDRAGASTGSDMILAASIIISIIVAGAVFSSLFRIAGEG